MTLDQLENFYIPEPTSGCWLWSGALTTRGYGQAWHAGRQHQAHRLTYAKKHGAIDPSVDLDHLCRNRACVNPDHLEPVPHVVNVQRGAKARITVDDVREIRKLHASGSMTHRQIAQRYAMSRTTIKNVVAGRNWKNVEVYHGRG